VSNHPVLIEKYDPEERDLDCDPQTQPTVELVFTKSHKGLGRDLASLLEGAGIKYRYDQIDYMVGPGVDYSSLTGEVIAVLGGAGGLVG
jgi:hypothetical protein